MNLHQLRIALLAALSGCERKRAESEPFAASSGEGVHALLERQRSIGVFWAACGELLKPVGFVDRQALLESVVVFRGDTVVRAVAAQIESALGCHSGMVFGIVDEPPVAVSLRTAQLIVARVQRQLSTIPNLGKLSHLVDFEEKWLPVSHVLDQQSHEFGFGVDGKWHMLGACLAHRGDGEVGGWCQSFEALLGLSAPDGSLEQAQSCIEGMTLAMSTAAHQQQMDELVAHESQGGMLDRKVLSLVVKTAAPLLRQHGFEPSARGLVQCKYQGCIQRSQLRADAATSSAPSQLPESSIVAGAEQDLPSRIDALESLVRAKDKYVAQLVAKLAENERDHKAIWAEVLIRDKDIAELTAQLVQKEAVLTRLQADVLAKSQSIFRLSDRISGYSCEMELVREEVDSTLKLVTDLAGDCSWPALERPLEQPNREPRDEEADLLRERLLEHMQSARVWRAEALEMWDHNAQLEAELEEIGFISRCAKRCFGVEEELDWEGGLDHRRSELEKGSHGWSQISALLSQASQHEIVSMEVIRSRWLELGCQSRLRQCGLAVDDFPATDTAKRRAVDKLEEQRVFGGPSNLIWAWRACDPSTVDGFARSGFVGTAATEPGAFGNGHYLHLEAEYACKLATGFLARDGHWCVVLVLVALARVRPLSWSPGDFQMQDVSDPADCKHFGKRLPKGGAHVVPVQVSGAAYNIARGPAECHDLVLDDDAQVLPFAICWFR